ncbi:N-acetylglucosaminyl-diphospho-decaprenol L-rhamnosyltransferase [Planctomycetes bacterium Pan216]|uniref:N-acetylglucosaminyl-diphospho-decaprenol L-rhamnosyltransferase n=1 Tax=Kolteria novifilia TaxID=2527975 RepID=A0A518B3H2_9BACT|nr:N-acetylglucosaminyl-diphospho-decaprenol L-rhamnosyltransferase [Planctomycetes bacterium Pan216]
MNGEILFFDVANPDHFPLVAEVSRRGHGIILNTPVMIEAATKAGLPFRTWDVFAPADLTTCANEAVGRLVERLRVVTQDPQAMAGFASPRGDVVGQVANPFFQEAVNAYGRAIATTETFEALLASSSLRLIVMGCDNAPWQRVLVELARQRGIATLQLAHGINPQSVAHIAGEMTTLYADYVAVFGERARRSLIGEGNRADRIVVTGAPHWDSFYREEARISREEARRRLGLDPTRPMIVYFATYPGTTTAFFPAVARRLAENQRMVIEALRPLGDEVQLVVRAHPHEASRSQLSANEQRELEEGYRRWLGDQGVSLARWSTDDKVETIRAADAVLFPAPSTAIPEAMILERPVVLLPWLDGHPDLYTTDDGILVASDEAELTASLRLLVREPDAADRVVAKQNASLSDLNAHHDGRATARTADFVASLASGDPPSRPTVEIEVAAKPLRILLVVHRFLPESGGGTERYTHRLAQSLIERGHEVRVMVPVNASANQGVVRESQFEGVPFFQVAIRAEGRATTRNEALSAITKSIVERYAPDVVHFQHPMGFGISLIEALHGQGIPVALTANDFWFACEQIHLVDPSGKVCSGPETVDKCARCLSSRLGSEYESRYPSLVQYIAHRSHALRLALREVDLMICPSKFLKDFFERHGYINPRIVHLPQGANLPAPARRRERLSLPVRLGYFGHLDYRKGTDLMVRAFQRLERGKAELHLHGPGADPSYERSIREMIRPEDDVTFHGGFEPEAMTEVLSTIDIAVVPSRGENYPFVIREILGAGVPVLASDVAGIPEIIEHGRNGLLFRGNDVDDFAVQLQRLVGEPGLIESLREGITPIKTIDGEAMELEALYRDLLATKVVPRLASEVAEERSRGVDEHERRGGATSKSQERVPLPALPPAEPLAERAGEPLVTVLLDATASRHLDQTLTSVLTQTYPNLEVLVACVRTDSHARAVVEHHGREDARIRLVAAEASVSWGSLLNETSGTFIKLLRSGDVLDMRHLERLVPLCERYPRVAFVKCGHRVIDEQGQAADDPAEVSFGKRAEGLLDGKSFTKWKTARHLAYEERASAMLFHRRQLLRVFAHKSTPFENAVAALLDGADVLLTPDTLAYSRTSPISAERVDLLAVAHGLEIRDLPVPTAPGTASGKTSVVIPVFNQVEFTRSCLASLEADPEGVALEIIVVDNGSTDETPAVLEQAATRLPMLHVVRNEENLGFAKACNQGVGRACGEYVLLLNNDTELRRDWLAPLVAILDADPKVAAVGNKLLYPDGRIQHAGVAIAEATGNDPLLAANVFDGSPADVPEADERREYQAVTAACMLLRRSAFEAVGGLDEGYWNGYEDVDLCFSLRAAGWKIVYEPSSVVIHHTSKSGPERFRKVSDNIKRLHEKWLGKVQPDLRLNPDGAVVNQSVGAIRPYSIPEGLAPRRTSAGYRTPIAPLAWQHPHYPDSGMLLGAESDLFALSEESYNICLCKPAGQSTAMAFLDIAKLLYHSFESLGNPCKVSVNHLEENAVNILLGYHLLADPESLLGRRCVIYQLEQLSDNEGWFNPHREAILRNAEAIWDYSEENVRFLKRRGLDHVEHLPIGFHDKLRTMKRTTPDIDVLFYGSRNRRRNQILEALGRHCRIRTLHGMYSEDRDAYIARSKIILNLHFYDAQIAEQARICYLLNNRCFVVSEQSVDRPFSRGIVEAPYEDLVETCLRCLNDDAERYRVAKEGFNTFKQRPMVDLLRRVLHQSSAEGSTLRTS